MVYTGSAENAAVQLTVPLPAFKRWSIQSTKGESEMAAAQSGTATTQWEQG